MASTKNDVTFKSIEHLKAEVFPRLVQSEAHSIAKLGSEQVGANMADEAINALLSQHPCR
jgi:hypothetical protein